MTDHSTPNVKRTEFALAFSGGGVRAMAFHAGVLRYLADRGQLEAVSHLSTVSGGTLLIGLVLQLNGMAWPSSNTYLTATFPSLRAWLTQRSLQWRATARLVLVPWNWRFALSRANVLAKEISHGWRIRSSLSQVPQRPTWSINGTTSETGRRFRFKDGECGDHLFGHAKVPDVPLAHAMAMSAAFPGGIGPLAFNCAPYDWYRRSFTNGVPSGTAPVQPAFPLIHLYDGGLYDNLGLEPLFDIATQRSRIGSTSIVVSDAGAPFRISAPLSALNPGRAKRWLDVTTDQQRDLRVRTFVHALKNSIAGAYLQIGTDAVAKLRQFAPAYSGQHTWISANDATAAAAHTTNLNRLTQHRFEILSQHGYETAKWNNIAFPCC